MLLRVFSPGVSDDRELFTTWLARYRDEPEKCASGDWVDAGFARDWYEANVSRPMDQHHLPIAISALHLGDVALAFHPSELYSCYGLAIQRSAPLAETIVVGYSDGLIGYLADPTAYRAGEYAAITVPRILDYPPFPLTAAAELSEAVVSLLKQTVG